MPLTHRHPSARAFFFLLMSIREGAWAKTFPHYQQLLMQLSSKYGVQMRRNSIARLKALYYCRGQGQIVEPWHMVLTKKWHDVNLYCKHTHSCVMFLCAWRFIFAAFRPQDYDILTLLWSNMYRKFDCGWSPTLKQTGAEDNFRWLSCCLHYTDLLTNNCSSSYSSVSRYGQEAPHFQSHHNFRVQLTPRSS